MCFIADIWCVMVSTMGDNSANGMRNVRYGTHVSQDGQRLTRPEEKYGDRFCR